MSHGNYCLALSLPAATHFSADMGLSALMISAPLWVGALNQWLALGGGVLGIALMAVRLWRAWRGMSE